MPPQAEVSGATLWVGTRAAEIRPGSPVPCPAPLAPQPPPQNWPGQCLGAGPGGGAQC